MKRHSIWAPAPAATNIKIFTPRARHTVCAGPPAPRKRAQRPSALGTVYGTLLYRRVIYTESYSCRRKSRVTLPYIGYTVCQSGISGLFGAFSLRGNLAPHTRREVGCRRVFREPESRTRTISARPCACSARPLLPTAAPPHQHMDQSTLLLCCCSPDVATLSRAPALGATPPTGYRVGLRVGIRVGLGVGVWEGYCFKLVMVLGIESGLGSGSGSGLG